MRRILVFIISALLASCFDANGQNLLERLGQRAKNAVENKLGEKVEQGVNDALDGKIGTKKKKEKADIPAEQQAQEAGEAVAASTWTCEECGKTGNAGKFCEECGAKKPSGEAAPAPKPKKQAVSEYAKSDFVPGDEIFFEDPVEGERLGEFPSHWDFLGGEECEVMTIDGNQAIKLSGWFTDIAPLMKEEEYLPEEFTVEFDVWSNPTGGSSNNDHIDLLLRSKEKSEYCVFVALNPAFNEFAGTEGNPTLDYSYYTPAGDLRHGTTPGDNVQKLVEPNKWLHVAASFNKRAFKYYVNGVRMVNLPNMARPTSMIIRSVSNCDAKDRFFIKNIRLAKGAVPLYDRLASDGKIITYAITFDIGKANIKPESMTEINRIAQLMKDNGDLKFEVQGHTDNTGTVAGNQKLSEQRAQAIVNKLVEMGIAANRLSAKGMGQSAPLADNSTDEGRAKNRRVEFIKK